MAESRLDLTDLPDDVIGEICSHLLPEAAAENQTVSKRFYSIIKNNLFWEEKVKRHFYKEYRQTLARGQSKINWQAIFITQCTLNYSNLTLTQRKLVSAFNENDLAAIKNLTLSYQNLQDTRTVRAGKLTFNLPSILSQEIRTYLYNEVIYPYYKKNHFQPDHYRRTLLHWALVCRIDREEISHLLKYNPHCHSQERYSQTQITPLMIAAHYGEPTTAELLITQYGALLNDQNKHKENALHYAARNADPSMVRYLLGAGLQFERAALIPPLAYAIDDGNADTLAALLAGGDDPTTTFQYDSQDVYASTLAAAFGQVDCLKVLLNHDLRLLNITDSLNRTPLQAATANGFDDAVEYLISKGADVDAISYKGATASILAVENGYWKILTRLLDAGANLTTLTNYLIAENNEEALTQLYTRRPALFNQLNLYSLLQQALLSDKHKIVGWLINHQKQLALQPDEEGYLPLHIAALNGSTECINALIRQGCPIDIKYHHHGHPDHGKSALFFAHESNRVETVKELLTRLSDKQLFETLIFAIQQDKLALAKEIIEHRPKVLRQTNLRNQTALAIAEELQNEAAIDVCYNNNVFEKANWEIFIDPASREALNNSIISLNENLKERSTKDIRLMLESQALLRKLNNPTVGAEEKITAVESYRDTYSTISNTKFLLCSAAIIAIAISVTVACVIAGVLIGAAATSWSGPGAAMGSFYGGLTGGTFGWQWGLVLGSAAVGVATEGLLLSKASFFGRTVGQYDEEEKAHALADDALAVIKRLP